MIVVEVRCSSVHKTNVVLLLAVECKQRWSQHVEFFSVVNSAMRYNIGYIIRCK